MSCVHDLLSEQQTWVLRGMHCHHAAAIPICLRLPQAFSMNHSTRFAHNCHPLLTMPPHHLPSLSGVRPGRRRRSRPPAALCTSTSRTWRPPPWAASLMRDSRTAVACGSTRAAALSSAPADLSSGGPALRPCERLQPGLAPQRHCTDAWLRCNDTEYRPLSAISNLLI